MIALHQTLVSVQHRKHSSSSDGAILQTGQMPSSTGALHKTCRNREAALLKKRNISATFFSNPSRQVYTRELERGEFATFVVLAPERFRRAS
jgi:hypothetical protein